MKRSHEDSEDANLGCECSVTCSLPPLCSLQPKTFSTRGQFEDHYFSCHTNICSGCRRNFPTPKLLDLHISENHDPFTRINIEKGLPVFGCFVEGCDRMFSTHKKRRLHLIDKHGYPKNFIFSVVDGGVSPSQVSLLKQEKSSKRT